MLIVMVVMMVRLRSCKRGTQPYSNYTLAGASTSNSNNGIFTNLTAGNYVVGVVDANNLTKTTDQAVTSPTPISTPMLYRNKSKLFWS